MSSKLTVRASEPNDVGVRGRFGAGLAEEEGLPEPFTISVGEEL